MSLLTVGHKVGEGFEDVCCLLWPCGACLTWDGYVPHSLNPIPPIP